MSAPTLDQIQARPCPWWCTEPVGHVDERAEHDTGYLRCHVAYRHRIYRDASNGPIDVVVESYEDVQDDGAASCTPVVAFVHADGELDADQLTALAEALVEAGDKLREITQQ